METLTYTNSQTQNAGGIVWYYSESVFKTCVHEEFNMYANNDMFNINIHANEICICSHTYKYIYSIYIYKYMYIHIHARVSQSFSYLHIHTCTCMYLWWSIVLHILRPHPPFPCSLPFPIPCLPFPINLCFSLYLVR